MKNGFFYLAVLGWLASVTVNALTVADIDVAGQVPFVFILHLGIFAVWIPAVLLLRKKNPPTADGKRNRLELKEVFKDTPRWMSTLALAGFVYGMLNFAYMMSQQLGSASIVNGQYVLENHGRIIKTITAQEYHHVKASLVRLFSGHWIAFYGMAASVLNPFSKNTNE